MSAATRDARQLDPPVRTRAERVAEIVAASPPLTATQLARLNAIVKPVNS